MNKKTQWKRKDVLNSQSLPTMARKAIRTKGFLCLKTSFTVFSHLHILVLSSCPPYPHPFVELCLGHDTGTGVPKSEQLWPPRSGLLTFPSGQDGPSHLRLNSSALRSPPARVPMCEAFQTRGCLRATYHPCPVSDIRELTGLPSWAWMRGFLGQVKRYLSCARSLLLLLRFSQTLVAHKQNC